MAFNPLGLGFMIPSAEEIAAAIVSEEALRRSEEELRRSEEEWIKGSFNLLDYFIHNRREENKKFFVSTEAEGKQPIYPHITLEQEIEALRSGEVDFHVLYGNAEKPNTYYIKRVQAKWVDETREEAKNPVYLRKIAEFDEMCKQDAENHYVVGKGNINRIKKPYWQE